MLFSLLLTLRGLVQSHAALPLEVMTLRHQFASPATVAAAAVAARAGGPMALGVAVVHLERVANGTRHRQTGDVIAWHRRGFRLFWTWKSGRRTGRPTVPSDVRALIRTMSQANPL